MNAVPSDPFADLAGAQRWVAWRNEERNGKRTKVPYGWHGRRAKANDAATWIVRAEAESRAKNLVNGQGGGIGIQLGDLGDERWLVGVDLDTCIDADGCLAAWAEKILSELPTYAEPSPSGTGIKAFFYIAADDVRPFLDMIGAKPDGWGIKRGINGTDLRDHAPGVEIYVSHRFFAVTGQLYPGSPTYLVPFGLRELERLAETLPQRQTPSGGKRGGRDTSRSARAFREGARLRREGKSFEEMCEALRNHADPTIAAWVREKGDPDGGRGLQRIWDNCEPANKVDHIAELNKTFAVIRVVNRVCILNEHLDADGHPSFSLLSLDSFKLLLANRKVEIVVDRDDDGNELITKVPITKLWIPSERRREHEGITFAPNGAPPGYYNMWTGFSLRPSAKGSCELFKAHLKDNVCDDDAALYNWVFGWFADIFQHPTEKCGTSLVLRGDMGVGKSIVGDTFGQLLGLHYMQAADPRYVTGRFNAHLVRCLLFHLDEGFWAGDHIAEGKVKDLVTGKRHPIELKGVEVFFVPNYVRIFISGNPGWLVPAGLGERRFATLDVADTHKEDIPYFRAIVDELRAGGYARLFGELLNFDLSSVDLRHIPKTEALLDQKIASASAEDGWWFDILQRGRLPHYEIATPLAANRCPGQLLYDDYIEHAQKQGARRRKIETAIGIFLNKTAPALTAITELFTIKDGTHYDPRITGRGRVYTFPPLDKCRQKFEEKLHQPITWPKEPTEWL